MLLLHSIIYLSASALKPSAGCFRSQKTTKFAQGFIKHDPIEVDSQSRDFYYTIPSAYSQNTPMKMLLQFHGQGGSAIAKTQGQLHDYPIIGVFPEGMNDYSSRNEGSGWNIHNQFDPNTCKRDVKPACYKS